LFKLGLTLLLGCFTLIAPSSLHAQAQRDRLKLVVVLSRHGVRSPTWTVARLNGYSAKPWPTWPAAPGELTDHGYKLLEAFGQYDRAAFAEAGLFASTGCEAAASTYIWADTDQRTLASGHALAGGLSSGCPPQVRSLAAGENDPLFHPPTDAVPATVAAAALTELQQRLAAQPVAADDPLLRSMQNLLNGCAATDPCTPNLAPQNTLFDAATAAVRGKGDHLVDIQGPLPLASTFSEDLLLEYAEGMPAANVGWGHVDEAELRRLIALHSRYFELLHRTPTLARLGSGPMLNTIARTLQQAIEGKPVPGALGPAGAKLVFLVGHDTNLAGITALLGAHWSLDGRADDTSPGTELAFELWQSPTGDYSVRTVLRQQTLRQMRELQPLTSASPPATANLHPNGYSWAAFQALVSSVTSESSSR